MVRWFRLVYRWLGRRDGDGDGGPFTYSTVNLDGAAHRGDALIEAGQPESAFHRRGRDGAVESATVVVDVENGLIVEEGEGAHHPRGVGVFADVGKGFLRGSVEGQFVFGGQGVRVAGHLDIDVETGLGGGATHKQLQSTEESASLERLRP